MAKVDSPRSRSYKGDMGIFDRMRRLVSSNVNAAIDKMSDPAKEIDQLVVDMEAQLKKARGEVQTALATEKRHRNKVQELLKSSNEWQERAERALRAGDENLAREALKRKADIDHEGQAAEGTLRDAQGHADAMAAQLKQLEARVHEVKSKKETLKAKARASKGKSPLGSSAVDEFDRLSGKVEEVEAEASLDEELAAMRHEDAKSREVERKLEQLGKDKDVDDRLAALKAKMEKKD
jgi:phage shock protein A